MRISTLARRSVATLAATALLTTGGAALGLTAGVANAQTVSGVTRIGGGAAVGVNNAVSGFQINGTDFMPSGQEAVSIRPTAPPGITGQGSIAGTVRDNAASCDKNVLGTVSPDAHCNGPLLFDVNLNQAAPGTYDVVVVQTTQAKFPNTTEPDVCSGCLTVVSPGPATTTGVAPSGTTNGPITITGTNFAHGAQVKWFNTDANGAATTVDPAFTLNSINVVNSTTITGVYSATAGAVGRKVVRVFNTGDAVAPGAGALFVQPDVGTVSPATLGQGATAVPVTVNGGLNGGGFNAQTTISWTDPKVTTAGPIVVAADGNSLVVPTSVASDAVVGAKTMVVKGTGGSYTTKSSAITVTAAPKPTSVSPASRGQGSSGEVTVNGSGFTSSTLFSFGQGIIAQTNAGTTTATAAKVNLIIDPAAALGARNVTATNPDKGSTTLNNAFTVVAKPVITSLDPPSIARNQSVNVAINGHDFATAGGLTVTVNDPTITVGPVTVNSSTLMHATFTAAPNATFGPHDVTVTNTTSQGKSTCTGCFGINSLTVSPTVGPNTGPKTLTLTGPGLDGTSVANLTIPGSQDYQGPIQGTTVACASPAVDTICRSFDLTGVATGHYTVTASTSGAPLSCTSCFLVAAVVDPAPTAASPASMGQGAVDRNVVITGSNFSPGEDVIFSGTGVTVSHVTYNGPNQLTAKVSIAPTAPTGARSVTVKNIGDGRSGTTGASAFTVTAGPKVTAVDIHVLGQNAVQDVTLTGSGFASGATASFGPGTSAVVKSFTATSLIATVTVSDTADTVPLRDIVVTNPDGGAGTLVGQFKVSPAPRITSIAPGYGKAGQTKSVVISGSGFVTRPVAPAGQTAPTACPGGDAPAIACPTVIVAGLLATVKSVSVDGTSMTADFAISANAPISNPAAKVINPDRGQSTKLAAFRIATVPVAPTNVQVVYSGTNATITWSFPTTANADGGSPLLSFTIDDGDASTNNTQTSTPDLRTAHFSGLTAGKVYAFSVRAVNAIGPSAPGTTQTGDNATTLTATRSKQVALAGDLINYTGKLTRTSTGAGAPDATILVTLVPYVGKARVFTTHTNSIGVWGFRYQTYYHMRVFAKFYGNATDQPSVSEQFIMATVPRLVKKSPANGFTSSAPLVVTGYVTPNKAGRTVYLVKRNNNVNTVVGRAIVGSNSSWTIRADLPRGIHLLWVSIAPSNGNTGTRTENFFIKRT